MCGAEDAVHVTPGQRNLSMTIQKLLIHESRAQNKPGWWHQQEMAPIESFGGNGGGLAAAAVLLDGAPPRVLVRRNNRIRCIEL